MCNVLFFSIIAKKKLNVDEEGVSLGFGGVFFPPHAVDLLSNLNELFDDFQGQYDIDFLVMVVKEEGKWKVFGFK